MKVTFSVSSIGNTKALLMCLSSVLMGNVLPAKIVVRLEGEFPGFNEFYLEQLSALARVYGIDFQISVGSAKGVRSTRQWHLDNCTTDYLWMGDDDVVYSPSCLAALLASVKEIESSRGAAWGYVVGSKPDVNNRRGYGDFSTAPRKTSDLKNYESFNQFYEGDHKTVRVNTCDTGNVLINIAAIRDSKIGFQPFSESYNSGGEDTLFGLACHQQNLHGFFSPTARSVHLEKERCNFGEFAARGEMLLRASEQLGYDKEIVTGEFMPFLKLNHS